MRQPTTKRAVCEGCGSGSLAAGLDKYEQRTARDAGRDARCSLLVQGPASSAGSGAVGLNCGWVGGACARSRVPVVCARAPSLTSVHDPGWLRAGDMTFDRVIPLG